MNTSALLQILITYGLLEEAYDLCIDYMVALVTNKEIDKFDIKVCFLIFELMVLLILLIYLEYNSIDKLSSFNALYVY